MALPKSFFQAIHPYLFAILIIFFAASLRLWPLQSLGARTVWVTFYPAVMVVALYGGILPGLLASVSSVAIALFAWPIFVPAPFIKDFGDWLSLVIFMVTCIGISVISEMMRRSQKRTKQAKEQAEKANKAKSVFLSNMSHELRTPFNAILGFSQIMVNDTEATSDQKEYLSIIIRSSEHLLNLINNILDIAKIESGLVHLEVRPANLPHLIQEIQSLMAVKATEKGLAFNVDVSKDLPAYILADSTKLRQVLINLIGNGIKFTVKGSITIRASVTATETSRRAKLRFEVEDTGPGISEADKARIFHSFVQLENNSTIEAGTGLGLAISKQYIELMGGSIRIDGMLGKGSVFSFEIPVEIPENEVAPEAHLLNRMAKLETGQPEYKIVIAEDQHENRLLLHTLLESAGFRVFDAHNGQEAIDLCLKHSPELVFMDMRMPVMGGIEATKFIKSNPGLAGIAIVALTAHALEDERQLMLNAGCDEFLRKPYTEYQIWEALENQIKAKFVYEPVQIDKKPASVTKNTIDIEALPPEIRVRLLKAAELLNGPGCMKILDEIRTDHPEIARFIRKLVENYDFQGLIRKVEKNTREDEK